MAKSIHSVAVIGGGPAGAALGALLAQKKYQVAVFHTDKRPPLIVGESLIPAIIPMLRSLGLEDEVKAFSIYKPGGTVSFSTTEVVMGYFKWGKGHLPDYAYNTPRDLFDASLLNCAERSGATVFKMPAKLERGEQPDTVKLSQETLDRTNGFFAGQPDFVVDATGRSRAIAKLLDLPTRRGGRNDVALFAHLDRASLADPGTTHVDHLTKGWSWRIPLPGRVSLGVVIDPKHLDAYGDDIETQYDRYLKDEPYLKIWSEGANRLTRVIRYTNYQLIADRMFGANWAMIGDAAGFVDPIFSPGVYLSVKSAFQLADALQSGGGRGMRKYEHAFRTELGLWQSVIDSWYDGRLFNLYRVGQTLKNHPIGRVVAPFFQKRLIRILSGESTSSPLKIRLFEYLMFFGVWRRDPKDLIVA